MIADDFNISNHVTGNYSLPKNKVIDLIIISIRNTHQDFLKAIKSENLHKNLNENKLTQIFVEQNDIHLRFLNLPIGVNREYSDVFYNIKGVPDFYYYYLELGKVNDPLFVVESKRLLSHLDKGREKEYVIGKTKSNNPNGGIERFKLGKHGVGLNQCGIMAFVEEEDNSIWFNKINDWILELAQVDSTWNKNEILIKNEPFSVYNHFTSTLNRKADKIKLNHFWIEIKSDKL
jgi:hypothetical protein